DSPIGTFVVDVNATDPDVIGKITYSLSLTKESVRVLFEIDEQSGVITTNAIFTIDVADTDGMQGIFEIDPVTANISTVYSLDPFEVTPFYNLTVIASDGGERPKSSTVPVYVTVTDVIDPTTPSGSECLSEDDTCGCQILVTVIILLLVVVSVIALYYCCRQVCQEKDRYNLGWRKIKGSSKTSEDEQVPHKKGEFFIDSNGTIYAVCNIDSKEIALYTLTVMATDNGEEPQNSTVPVDIIVIDFNDNTSTFTESHFNGFVEENVQYHVKTVQVIATDADEGYTADVYYTILCGDDGDFAIDNE
ncbi:protocadherin gamma-B2-like, partial [Saccoglossus kowalevskii]|uniref:Protocadherin-like wing polarity protein stan-like n=1 Tax=Saccoglossus kowalevskii TaxID=10224 RepID=A0ABM0MB63_SACKO